MTTQFLWILLTLHAQIVMKHSLFVMNVAVNLKFVQNAKISLICKQTN